MRPGDAALFALNLPVFSECPQERDGHSKSQVLFWRGLNEWTIYKAVDKIKGGQQGLRSTSVESHHHGAPEGQERRWSGNLDQLSLKDGGWEGTVAFRVGTSHPAASLLPQARS